MNPLIKELASKALKQPDTDNDGLTVFDNDELEKFAELIVKECAKVADIADENKCEWIGGNVLTHFGVEE